MTRIVLLVIGVLLLLREKYFQEGRQWDSQAIWLVPLHVIYDLLSINNLH